MSRPFAVLDVFTDRLFGGNRLAIVSDARGLDAPTMQAIAREFDFPETIFLLPPDDAANDVKVRIFTPGSEIPFAGHPNIGLGVWLAAQAELFGRAVGDVVRAEEGAGLVVLDLDRSGPLAHATLTAPAPFTLGRTMSPARVAAAARLPEAAIALGRHAPVFASVGFGFTVTELVSRAHLSAARCAPDRFDTLAAADGLHQALYYVREGEGRVAMRMFAPEQGIVEDPATGSAAAALVALLAHLEPSADAVVNLAITQGDEMGRPSRIAASAQKRAGVVGPVRVGGTAVAVMDGTLRL